MPDRVKRYYWDANVFIALISNLKTADAVHVASAVFARVDEMHTYDGSGRPKGILSLDYLVGRPPMKIVVPHWEGNLPLFESPP